MLAVAIGIGIATEGCNDVGRCPAKTDITPGGACSGDSLECAFDLATPTLSCDGTVTTISTSCVCTKGTWACPSPASCEASAGDDGGGTDASGGDAGADSAGGNGD